ncbi:MAG TPA: FAD-dependent monooxygenase [Trebonia sp.]|jgi:2-polyprenyl-6-methoxyphenol hydroxylase-like FAD-dependent oxidoreductase|nr:FAD-dependent monooxygenase [Trebonia sp.]
MGDFDVVIAGGGPVGLWLAAELRRADVRVVVLEKRAERVPYSKAMTMYPRTIEMFAMRGVAERFLAEGRPLPSSHFAILSNRLDFSFLETRYPFTLFLPQRRTEELLEEQLAELGVPLLRSHEVTGVRQIPDETHPSGVAADVRTPSGPAVFSGSYLVGCDGAGSVVRRAAGIGFDGTPSTWYTIMGDVEMSDPPSGPALTLSTRAGSLFMLPVGGSRWRIATVDYATLHAAPEGPVSFGDLRATALRLAGTDFGMRETPDAWLSRVGSETRQAAAYRAGRVFLAGDAAHIHFPAGGQGLNLGLQDAANLAWKLSLAVHGRDPSWLLDSYEAERIPVGLEVIEDSLAQCGLFANPSREGVALRDRFNRMLGENQSLSRSLAVRLSGLGIRYAPAGGAADPRGAGSCASPLAGRRVPDLDLRDAPAQSVYGLLRPGKFVLLGLPAVPAPLDIAKYSDNLEIVTAEFAGNHPEWADVRAMLIRPDGYLAWALRESDPVSDPPLAAWLG